LVGGRGVHPPQRRTRLIAVILSYEGTPQADLHTAQDVIDTLDLNP
jgi:hypothetical protein